MNSSFVLLAYFAMVLSPCFVATYGDVLSVRWLLALARRRRTHRAESFRVSVRNERYAMAVAMEASFAASSSEDFAAPKPFLVPKRSATVENAAFVEGRQRVAARLAQLAVANKLRTAAEAAEKIVAIPADVPTMAETVGVHIRPRKPVAALAEALEAAHLPTHLVIRETVTSASASAPYVRDLAEVAAASSPPSAGPETAPFGRKPGESDVLEIAA